MPILKRLENFLKKQRAFYQVVTHKTIYTTFDLSQTLHEDLKLIAKTLLVQADRDFVFAVVPGHKYLDVSKLKKLINLERKKAGEAPVKKLNIATETQIKRSITKKVGALVPFGSLYRKQTYVDRLLLKNKKVILNAGSFEESIRITTSVYRKVEQPIEGSFSKIK